MNLSTKHEDADDTKNPPNITDSSLSRETSNPLDSVCAICMLTFRVDEAVAWSLRLTTCSHVYHTSCLREWFERSNRYGCVYCRGDFRGISDSDVHRQIAIMNEEYSDEGDGRSPIMDNRKRGCFCLRHGLMLPSISNE